MWQPRWRPDVRDLRDVHAVAGEHAALDRLLEGVAHGGVADAHRRPTALSPRRTLAGHSVNLAKL